MSDFKVLKNYISGSASIVSGFLELLLTPKEFIDDLAPDAGDISYLESIKIPEYIIMGCTAVKHATTAAYYYDEYFEPTTKVKNKTIQWLIFGLVALHAIAIGVALYYLLKQNPATKKKLGLLFSGFVSPVLGLGMGITSILLAYKSDKTNWRHKTQAILDMVAYILACWKFAPVKKALLANPYGFPIVLVINAAKVQLSVIKLAIMPKD